MNGTTISNGLLTGAREQFRLDRRNPRLMLISPARDWNGLLVLALVAGCVAAIITATTGRY